MGKKKDLASQRGVGNTLSFHGRREHQAITTSWSVVTEQVSHSALLAFLLGKQISRMVINLISLKYNDAEHLFLSLLGHIFKRGYQITVHVSWVVSIST